ncbi:hypothetical protein OIU77_012736, partial [Salix suchowensis]
MPCHTTPHWNYMFVLVVVELEAHAIMNLVILEGNMVLVDVVPLLDPDLLSSGTGLCRHKLLEVSDRVVFVALHSHFLSQTIVQHHLQHLQRNSCQTQTLDRKDFFFNWSDKKAKLNG